MPMRFNHQFWVYKECPVRNFEKRETLYHAALFPGFGPKLVQQINKFHTTFYNLAAPYNYMYISFTEHKQ